LLVDQRDCGGMTRLEQVVSDHATDCHDQRIGLGEQSVGVGKAHFRAHATSGAGRTTEAAFQRPVHRLLTRYVLALWR